MGNARTSGDAVQLTNDTDAPFEAIAEPFLELREHEYSVTLQHISGSLLAGDRATLDLVTEDGRHRLRYGLLVDNMGSFLLVADYVTFDDQGEGVVTSIGQIAYPGTNPVAKLVIRQQGAATNFLVGSEIAAPTQVFTTNLAPLDWIGYMRPILHTQAQQPNTYLARAFNDALPPVGEACPASTIRETFEPDLSAEWQRLTPNGNCTIAADAGGDLRMAFTDGDAIHECVIHTSTLYNLRDHQLQLELAEVVPVAATFMKIELEIETRTSRARLRLDIPSSTLKAIVGEGVDERSVGGTTIEPGQLATRAVWRISGTGNDELVFELGDGVTFKPLGASQANELGRLDQVRVRLIAFGAGIGQGAGARFSEIRSQ